MRQYFLKLNIGVFSKKERNLALNSNVSMLGCFPIEPTGGSDRIERGRALKQSSVAS